MSGDTRIIEIKKHIGYDGLEFDGKIIYVGRELI